MSTQKRKDSPIGRKIMDIILIGLSLFHVIPNVLNIIEAEAREVKRSIAALALLYCIATVVMLSVWMSLLGIGIVFLMSLQLSLLHALIITFCGNLFLLIIVFLFISKEKRNISLKRTRAVIANLIR